MKKNINGFTLIELSIVMVILGLIVGGVVAAQVLVDNAYRRTLISEVNSYKTAINIFKTEYNALPGDMENAHDYWQDNCDSSANRCNGNGNGFVGWVGSDSGSTNATTDNETFRAWQHLSLAELLSAYYDGISSGDTQGATSAEMPYSKSGKGKFLLISVGTGAFHKKNDENMLVLGGPEVGQNIWMPGTSVADAMWIDSKMDDGVANTGSVFAADGNGTTLGACSTTRTTSGGANYDSSNLASKELYCIIEFFF